MKSIINDVLMQSNANDAIISAILEIVEGSVRSKSTQALVQKDNPTEGEIRRDQEKGKAKLSTVTTSEESEKSVQATPVPVE